ncbi:MAG: TIGR01777 family oxidoreductase [Saprospiraceae bacterium]
MKDKIILICGGSGMIGTALSNYLTQFGIRIRILTRQKKSSTQYEQFLWNPYKEEIDSKALDDVYGVINLAGASIGSRRWSKKRKMEIYNSRILSTRFMIKCINARTIPPEIFVSTSAIGVYGNRGNEIMDEDSLISTEDFLSNLCIDWEAEVSRLDKNIRSVILRIGLVLSMEDGLLAKSMIPAKIFLTPVFGSGKQIYSWIHIQDLLNIFGWILNHETSQGIYIAVSLHPISQSEFAMQLSKTIHRYIIPFHLPAFLLNLILGKFSTSLLDSQHILSKKLISEGFVFTYPTLPEALENLLMHQHA